MCLEGLDPMIVFLHVYVQFGGGRRTLLSNFVARGRGVGFL